MNYHHSLACPTPHTVCVCGANDAMLLWADQQSDRIADHLDRYDIDN